MKKQIITTGAAPRSLLFSQGVKVGSTIYVSGMAGIDPATVKRDRPMETMAAAKDGAARQEMRWKLAPRIVFRKL